MNKCGAPSFEDGAPHSLLFFNAAKRLILRKFFRLAISIIRNCHYFLATPDFAAATATA